MEVFCLYYTDRGIEVELAYFVTDRCDLSIDEDKAAAEAFLRNSIDEEAVQRWNHFGPQVRKESSAA